jgi:hypothetical protein
MGQLNSTENHFREAIINGLLKNGVIFTNKKNYKDLNYGLIIKPLNMDYNLREPIRMYFKGYPYHVGIIRNDLVYSFCPDLREPHRGTLQKDVIVEKVQDWEGAEIFWFVDKPEEYTYELITSRLIDLLNIKKGILSPEEFNIRYGTNIKQLYNLLSNNCTDVAMTVLIAKTVCFQIESIAGIIKYLSSMKQLMKMLPPYAEMWLADFKYVN